MARVIVFKGGSKGACLLPFDTFTAKTEGVVLSHSCRVNKGLRERD